MFCISQIFLQAEKKYFEKCDEAVRKWRAKGPQPLNSGSALENEGVDRYTSGIWLFRGKFYNIIFSLQLH